MLDGSGENAWAVGTSVVVARICVETGSLEALLAHELGHLAHHDGRNTAAINRLLFKWIPGDAWAASWLRGELWLEWISASWSEHFRVREYAADDYAASLGCGHDLADHFEALVAFDQPVPYRWLSKASHPPIEYRIERLREAAERYDQYQGDCV